MPIVGKTQLYFGNNSQHFKCPQDGTVAWHVNEAVLELIGQLLRSLNYGNILDTGEAEGQKTQE